MYEYLFLGIIIGMVIAYIMYQFNTIYCPSIDNITQILLRQSGRWLVASEQDNSPLISLLHAIYGFGYFMALKEISTENTINKFTNAKLFEKELNETLDINTKKVVNACPQYANNLNTFFAKFAGNMGE